jgi:hypothetical protein
MSEHGKPVTPVDEFTRWKRDGERRLEQLNSYRDTVEERFRAARAELEATDAAISELLATLTPEMAVNRQETQARDVMRRRIAELEAILERSVDNYPAGAFRAELDAVLASGWARRLADRT